LGHIQFQKGTYGHCTLLTLAFLFSKAIPEIAICNVALNLEAQLSDRYN